jgi:hypothetical protein
MVMLMGIDPWIWIFCCLRMIRMIPTAPYFSGGYHQGVVAFLAKVKMGPTVGTWGNVTTGCSL